MGMILMPYLCTICAASGSFQRTLLSVSGWSQMTSLSSFQAAAWRMSSAAVPRSCSVPWQDVRSLGLEQNDLAAGECNEQAADAAGVPSHSQWAAQHGQRPSRALERPPPAGRQRREKRWARRRGAGAPGEWGKVFPSCLRSGWSHRFNSDLVVDARHDLPKQCCASWENARSMLWCVRSRSVSMLVSNIAGCSLPAGI